MSGLECANTNDMSMVTPPNKCSDVLDGQVSTRQCRASLTEQQVLDIYRLRPSNAQSREAERIAGIYGVSEKAIRDIWNGRTWKRQTLHHAFPQSWAPPRPRGRPKGSKSNMRWQSMNQTQSKNGNEPDIEDIDRMYDFILGKEPQSNLPRNTIEQTLTEAAFNLQLLIHVVPATSSVIPPSAYDDKVIIAKSDDPFHDDFQYWSVNAAPCL